VPGAATGEHLPEHCRTIRHDSVNPEIEESVHLRRIVDGPHVDSNVATVAAPDEAGSDDRDRPSSDGNLCRLRTAREPGEPQHGQFPRAGSGTQLSPQHAAQGADPPIVERGEAHPLERGMSLDHVDEGPSAVLALAVDVETSVRPGIEELVECRDRLGAMNACLGELGGT
jgi:hypothetical protein